jgi:hypothetical protein
VPPPMIGRGYWFTSSPSCQQVNLPALFWSRGRVLSYGNVRCVSRGCFSRFSPSKNNLCKGPRVLPIFLLNIFMCSSRARLRKKAIEAGLSQA